MRAIKLAGLMGLLVVSGAMAQVPTGSTVTIGLTGSYGGGDLSAVNPAADPIINFVTDIAVTGPNQGICQFLFSMGVYNAADYVKGHEVATSAGPYGPGPRLYGTGWVEEAYKAPGSTAAGSVKDKAGSGGPGLDNGLGGYGYPNANFAWIEQAGNGYPLKWIGRAYVTYTGGGTRKKWQGDLVWGVGMASRKDVLLQDPNGKYPLFNGTLDVTGWAEGTYVVKVWPASAGNSVMRTQVNINGVMTPLDLNLNWEMNIFEFVAPNEAFGGEFRFVIVPEPATMLLLAGAAALIRRRRA